MSEQKSLNIVKIVSKQELKIAISKMKTVQSVHIYSLLPLDSSYSEFSLWKMNNDHTTTLCGDNDRSKDFLYNKLNYISLRDIPNILKIPVVNSPLKQVKQIQSSKNDNSKSCIINSSNSFIIGKTKTKSLKDFFGKDAASICTTEKTIQTVKKEIEKPLEFTSSSENIKNTSPNTQISQTSYPANQKIRENKNDKNNIQNTEEEIEFNDSIKLNKKKNCLNSPNLVSSNLSIKHKDQKKLTKKIIINSDDDTESSDHEESIELSLNIKEQNQIKEELLVQKQLEKKNHKKQRNILKQEIKKQEEHEKKKRALEIFGLKKTHIVKRNIKKITEEKDDEGFVVFKEEIIEQKEIKNDDIVSNTSSVKIDMPAVNNNLIPSPIKSQVKISMFFKKK